jgi:hypothetical protein
MPTSGASGGYTARGMAVLNEAKPHWPQRVDLATFDMSPPGRSMLVQMFGSMDKGLANIGIPPDRAAAYEFLVSILPRSAPG